MKVQRKRCKEEIRMKIGLGMKGIVIKVEEIKKLFRMNSFDNF